MRAGTACTVLRFESNVAMRSAHVIQIVTPKKVVLDGLWIGPKKPQRVIIWIHGLGSSLFSKLDIAYAIVDSETAVLTFNNRGHDKVARVTRGKTRMNAGAAHEVFTDCVDDIEGAIRYASAAGAPSIYLAGHSTGCQKSIYWAARKKGKGVKGIILLAPISDYAAMLMGIGPDYLKRALAAARKRIKEFRGDQLLPHDVSDAPLDAHRFVSLYSGESEEETFPYWAPKRVPTTLRKVKTPTLIFLARRDQYNDRPAEEMAEWFMKHVPDWRDVTIVNESDHSFEGGEEIIVRHVRGFFLEVEANKGE